MREAGGAALRAYRPKPYPDPITFFKAMQRDTEFPDDPERIWRCLTPRVVFRAIAGGHRTIVTTHTESAAAALTACLSTGRRGTPKHIGQAGNVAPPFEISSPRPLQSRTV